uniref:Uncharacterized protein n=1 Tax=Cannabis sativa TaxID=3483 RepID=A0A803PC87_CANSA
MPQEENWQRLQHLPVKNYKGVEGTCYEEKTHVGEVIDLYGCKPFHKFPRSKESLRGVRIGTTNNQKRHFVDVDNDSSHRLAVGGVLKEFTRRVTKDLEASAELKEAIEILSAEVSSLGLDDIS